MRNPYCYRKDANRRAWSNQEDQKLIGFVQAHGEGCWRSLPRQAGENFIFFAERKFSNLFMCWLFDPRIHILQEKKITKENGYFWSERRDCISPIPIMLMVWNWTETLIYHKLFWLKFTFTFKEKKIMKNATIFYISKIAIVSNKKNL